MRDRSDIFLGMVGCALLLWCLPTGAAASEAAGASAKPAHQTAAHARPSPRAWSAHHYSQVTASTAPHAKSQNGKLKKGPSARHGQQKIDSERALAIQQALVRAHYLTAEPTGQWDDPSQKAMEKFQADNGWQSKVVPDSRALIKLGLGPNQDHLLNPETAMTAAPSANRSAGPSLTDVPPDPPAPQK